MPVMIPRSQRLGAPVALGGLQPFTSIDFPGRLAAVLFCQGCAWRCAYCHNESLWPLPDVGEAARWREAWQSALAFLHQRRGLLDGVVFSGGEPLVQAGLPEALAEVRLLGFATALHTAGASPGRLRRVLPHCDWIGLDIKGLPADYPRLTGTEGGRAAWAALTLLLDSGLDYEVRTTWDQRFLGENMLLELAGELAQRGVRRWVVQTCRDARQRPQAAPGQHLQARLRERLPEMEWRQ